MANLGNQSENRIRTDIDEKMQTPILQLSSIRPPEGIGIFDEPTRCYRINVRWATILEGWLDWLTTPAFWIDAEDDEYIGCVEFKKFLIGEECCGMCLTCEEIQACLPDAQVIKQLLNYTKYQYNTDNSINVETYTTNTGTVTVNYNEANGNLPSIPYSDDQSDNTTNDGINFNCDRAYGAAIAIRDWLDSISRDVLNQLNIYNNPIQLLNNFISAIPAGGDVAELIGVDSLLNLFSSYLLFPRESYDASYNTTLQQNIACELLCEFSGARQISMQIVINWLREKLSLRNLSIGSIIDVNDGILTQTYTGDNVVYALWLSLLEGSRYLSTINIADLDTINDANKQLQAGQGQPSNAWTTLCTSCSRWSQTIDFTNPSTFDPAWLSIDTGILTDSGLEGAEYIRSGGNHARKVEANILFSLDGTQFTLCDQYSIEIEFTGTNTNTVADKLNLIFTRSNSNQEAWAVNTNFPENDIFVYTESDEGVGSWESSSGTGVWMERLFMSVNTVVGNSSGIPPELDGQATIKKLTLSGTGVNPFTLEGQPC